MVSFLEGRPGLNPSIFAVFRVCPLSSAKLGNAPARCTRWIFQVGGSLIGPVQWVGWIRGASGDNLVVSDEYVGPYAKMRECCFHGNGVDSPRFEAHVVFDNECVAS